MKYTLISIVFVISLHAQSWSVVTASKNLHIKENALQNIYLKKMTQSNQYRLIVLNLSSTHTARKVFMQKVLHVNALDWSSYYDEMHFMGIKAPIVVESIASMLTFLHKIEGSVGYVPSSYVDDTLIEITQFSW